MVDNIKDSCVNNYFVHQTINNNQKYYLKYYLGFLALLCAIITIDCGVYFYLHRIQTEKEEALVEGISSSISNLIINDLKLIFNPLQDLNKLTILNNYAPFNKIDQNFNIVGNIVYVNRGVGAVIFDFQPVELLVNSILTENFYYKITLSNNFLLSNIEDREFTYTRNYLINNENSLGIKLSYKPTSLYLENYNLALKHEILIILIGSVVVFLLLLPLMYYLIKKKEQFSTLKSDIAVLNKAHKLNIKYIKNCQAIEEELFPFQENNLNNKVTNIDIAPLLEEIEIYTFAYTIRNRFKFELNLKSEVRNINLNFKPIILKQIIISLLHNILYFMRAGDHTKKLSVSFEESKITFIYDSFAANEESMNNWSKSLFHHLGNPYILDCQKIFRSVKDYNLSYEVIPEQGKNKIIIFLNKTEVLGRVIKFKSN